MKDKSSYSNLDHYFIDLINENKKVFSNSNAVWSAHAGFRKHKVAKTILHDSLLELKKTLNELYSGLFFISTIVKLDSIQDYAYFVFFPEHNFMIKIIADASYEDIFIDQVIIKKDMNCFYADRIFDYVFSSKFSKTEEAKQYTISFCNAVKELSIKN